MFSSSHTMKLKIPLLVLSYIMNLTISSSSSSNNCRYVNNPCSSSPSNADQYRGDNGISYYFTITGSTTGSSVWGTDIYADTSKITKACVHAGAIAAGDTDTVNITILPGQSSYTSTNRYGITTTAYGSWPGSFKCEKVCGTGCASCDSTGCLTCFSGYGLQSSSCVQCGANQYTNVNSLCAGTSNLF